MLTNKKIILGMGAVICSVFALSAPQAWKVLGSVHDRQVAANDRLIEWKAAYSALLPVNDSWKSAFTSETEATDLLKLFRFANIEQHGLVANVDLVKQTASSPVLVNGVEVGLQKLCLASGSEAMEVTATSVTNLRNGLRSISARRDLSLGSVEFSVNADTGVALAKIKPFCVLVRTSGSAAPGGDA